jgi:hypothetical protein
VTRQVIKLGSSSIASQDGLALDVIASLVSQIAAAQRDGHEIILVTSGAARLGRRLLAFEGPAAGAAPALHTLVEGTAPRTTAAWSPSCTTRCSAIRRRRPAKTGSVPRCRPRSASPR